MSWDAAAHDYDAMLDNIRRKIEREGNPGDAWPDEYARYAVNHGFPSDSLDDWAHLVMVQPDPVHDETPAGGTPEPVAPSEAGIRRLAETLAGHTGADLSDPDTLDNYLFDARQLAPYMPHLLTYDERYASARTADLD